MLTTLQKSTKYFSCIQSHTTIYLSLGFISIFNLCSSISSNGKADPHFYTLIDPNKVRQLNDSTFGSIGYGWPKKLIEYIHPDSHLSHKQNFVCILVCYISNIWPPRKYVKSVKQTTYISIHLSIYLSINLSQWKKWQIFKVEWFGVHGCYIICMENTNTYKQVYTYM